MQFSFSSVYEFLCCFLFYFHVACRYARSKCKRKKASLRKNCMVSIGYMPNQLQLRCKRYFATAQTPSHETIATFVRALTIFNVFMSFNIKFFIAESLLDNDYWRCSFFSYLTTDTMTLEFELNCKCVRPNATNIESSYL